MRRSGKPAEFKDELQFPEDMEFNLSDFALFLSVMKNREAHQKCTEHYHGGTGTQAGRSPCRRGCF